MNTLMVLGGIVSLIWGFYALSRPTKSLPLPLKYAPVLLTGMGALLIWSHLASITPVIPEATITVLHSESRDMTVNLKIRKARACKLVSTSVYGVTADGEVRELSILPPENGLASTTATGTFDLGEARIVSYDSNQYQSFFFVTEHLCSFDIPVQSTFGGTVMPKEFNATK